MRNYLEMLAFVTIGIFLLWFGYSLLSGQWSRIHRSRRRPGRQIQDIETGSAGDPQTCPICISKLDKGDLVKTLAFPSITGGRDRLMYIRGCIYCLTGRLPRHCPVCGSSLGENEILVARLFEREHRRSHVHVIGCTKCRKMGLK